MTLPRKILALICVAVMLCFPARSAAQINTDNVMRVGRNALYFEDYMLAIQYFNLVIAQKPYMADAYLFRAIAKLNLDDYHGAADDAAKALEIHPFLSDAYEVRGVALQNLGQNVEAVECYDYALERLPDNRQILYNKAMAQTDAGDSIASLTTFNHLLDVHPGYDNALVGRARLLVEMSDTIGAVADLDRAIEAGTSNANAYVMRAGIAIDLGRDFESALADMNRAIELQPQYSGLFVNRAYLRYQLNDLSGAMADYDYAITLDPLSAVAYFNRGILRTEVYDNNRAIDDFDAVLRLKPEDIGARFNRALLKERIGDLRGAIDDLSAIIERMPEASAPLFMRSDLYMKLGDRRHAMADYDKAMPIARHERDAIRRGHQDFDLVDTGAENAATDEATESSALFASRFNTLLTIDNEPDEVREYNNSDIRGRVQNRNVNIDLEPDFFASYFTSPTELSPSTYYMQEINSVNASRQLPAMLYLTNRGVSLAFEQEISGQFSTVSDYNERIAASASPRAIDFFGLGMAYFMLRNYDDAATSFGRAIDITPDFGLAYFMRAESNARALSVADESISPEMAKALTRSVIDDYQSVARLSPLNAFPHFNSGNLYMQLGDITSAIAAYTRAIEINPEFGEAYFNRGYAYFRLGNREAGVADLSRAGQLGILPSYNLLKRMTK